MISKPLPKCFSRYFCNGSIFVYKKIDYEEGGGGREKRTRKCGMILITEKSPSITVRVNFINSFALHAFIFINGQSNIIDLIYMNNKQM